jgi:AraC-like DNA-binding protein
MNFSLHTIIPELQPYIKVISSIECTHAEDTAPFRVLPDLCTELFISYSDQPLAITTGNSAVYRSFLSSRLSAFTDVQMQPGAGCIAVCFHPGTAQHFFSLPMNELADSSIDLEYIWKSTAAEIEEKIASAKNNNDRSLIIQQYLLHQFSTNHKNDETIKFCLWQMNLKEPLSINELAEKTGVSQRHLSRKFNNYLGISPKEYARMNRFLISLDKIKMKSNYSLTEIAYESGYFDQAHFIHDFKSFAGITPGNLFGSQRIIF